MNDNIGTLEPLVFANMHCTAESFGWPENYRCDLAIDQRYLSGGYSGSPAPESFLWILRDCGTHIVDLDRDKYVDVPRGGWRSASAHLSCIEYCFSRPKHYYHCNARTGCIRKVTAEQAARIARKGGAR